MYACEYLDLVYSLSHIRSIADAAAKTSAIEALMSGKFVTVFNAITALLEENGAEFFVGSEVFAAVIVCINLV